MTTATSHDLRLQLQDASFTLSRGGRFVLSCDPEGRVLTWFEDGTLYKRSLGSRVLARRSDGGRRQRWTLSDREAAEVFGRIRAFVASALNAPLPRAPLERAFAWTPERLLAERATFDRAYAPVSILPPDQYFSVVLQATLGCSWNKCTFCTFYEGRPFTVKTQDAFEAHVAAVRDLLGDGAALRRSLFLADGNALMVANAKLLPMMHAARRAFPGRDFHGFVDVFTGGRKTVEGWSELREAGLRRVYLGLETGHDPLLAWVNKPGGQSEAIELVTTLKTAGLNVAPILMLGVGGERFADAHVRDTLALLDALPLGPGDLVYLSPFVQHAGGEYAKKADADGIAPLEGAEIEAQFEVLRDAVKRVHPGVRTARYDIREFLY